MTSTSVEQAVETLTQDSTSYNELLNLYRSLQEPIDDSPENVVAKKAIAQVVGELADYLDFVTSDLEKSIGLSRTKERQRLLSALEKPDSDDPVQQAYMIVNQWQHLKRYSFDEPLTDQFSTGI